MLLCHSCSCRCAKCLAMCLMQSVLAAAVTAPPVGAQTTGRLSGTVSRQETGDPVPDAMILILELGRSTVADRNGAFEFERIPPGSYHVVSHLEQVLNGPARRVEIQAGEEVSLQLRLSIKTQRFEITVTASEKAEPVQQAFQDVESFESLDLVESMAGSLGEALDHQVGTGIAKRGFGPGAARPIIRGFDGNRVLIMEDGLRTGTLSGTSGDHPEVINVAQIERLEIVKGPATLLYSGNATGGTVNAISRQFDTNWHSHRADARGYLSVSGGTTNSLGAANAGFEAGSGNLRIWGHGGGTRVRDYTAPEVGEIYNSHSRMVNTGGGAGWFGSTGFVSTEVRSDTGRNGVPFAQDFHGHHDHGDEEHGDGEHGDAHELDRVTLESERMMYRVNTGLQNLGGPFESVVFKFSHANWKHDELEYFEDGDSAIGTSFRNQRFAYRGVVEQARQGVLSGRFGVWGLARDFEAAGEEALTPPIDQSGLAFFALEEFEFERFKLQFGARLETQKYVPAYTDRAPGEHHGDEEHDHEDEADHHAGEHEDEHVHAAPDAIERSFAGASFAAGLHADLWGGGAFVTNFTRSYRAPALEELYNFGPHAGTLTFDIGDPSLMAESGNGIDLSLRQRTGRVQAEFNLFYYGFSNFIFPHATGERVDGLAEIEYSQRDARFTGTEANLTIDIHQNLDLILGLDYVDAKDTETNTYLPRIPPLRGSVGIQFRHKGFSISPTLVLAGEQNRTFTGETRTPEYSVVNLKASYTYARRHTMHQFAVNVFNIGDQFYRNHSSFIKDLAPEIGRGVRFTYMMRFF